MLFSERKNLENEYYEWLQENQPAKDCPYNVIVFLEGKDLLHKKGKWIDGMEYVNSHWKVCSVCHRSAHESCGGDNFCPNCGTDMREENYAL